MTTNTISQNNEVLTQPKGAVEVQSAADKSEAALIKARAKRLQRLILQGEWLEKHELQLKVVQGIVCNAMSEWYEDDSEECDEKAMYEMRDALMLLVDIIRDLRISCHCPDEKREGILYYHGFQGAVTEVVDLNKELGK